MKQTMILLSLVVVCCWTIAPNIAAAPFRVGKAVEDITPPEGWRMAGYFSERFNTGTRKPLKAKALVLRQGDAAAVFVFCDVLGTPRYVTGPAKERISLATGIPATNISIGATHVHTGPLYFGPVRDEFHKRAVAAHGKDPHEPIDYIAFLIDRIVAAVKRADSDAQAATVTSVTVPANGLSFNRRWHMKNGPVKTNPGMGNPDSDRSAGPVDPNAEFVLFRTAKGTPLASLGTFTTHTDTVGGREYDGDYPAVVAECLQKTWGNDFCSAFGLGACGDINHCDYAGGKRLETQYIGKQLAAGCVKELENRKPQSPSLSVASAVVEAPVREYHSQIAWAKKIMSDFGKRRIPTPDRALARVMIDLAQRDSDTLPMTVRAVRLTSDTAVVTAPGQMFVELGLEIKRRSPFPVTLVYNLTDDVVGYIPTRKGHEEGSYEVINSRITPGTGEKMVDTAVELLDKLHSDSK